MKKLIIALVIAFAVFYVIQNPTQAADMGRGFVGGVVDFASALAGGGQ